MSLPERSILRPAPLEPLAPRDASSPVPPEVPPHAVVSGSKSDTYNSGSSASTASSSSFAAAFYLAVFQ